MSTISICFISGGKVIAFCEEDGNLAEGQIGKEFSIACGGKTVYIFADSSLEGASVRYSIGKGTSSLDTSVIADSAGHCTTITSV